MLSLPASIHTQPGTSLSLALSLACCLSYLIFFPRSPPVVNSRYYQKKKQCLEHTGHHFNLILVLGNKVAKTSVPWGSASHLALFQNTRP